VWRRFAVGVVKPSMLVLTRRTWAGQEHVPARGGVILVANHISQADPLAIAHFVYDARRWPSFLAKDSLFTIPVLGWLLREVGQIPVKRGTADAAKALDAAVDWLRRDESLIIYPEGTTTREPDLWPMRGKTGIARLWLATGVPVVPIVTWGPQKMYDPRTNKLRLRFRTPVTVVAGPPLDLSRWADARPDAQVLADITEHVMLHLRDMVSAVRGGTPAPPLFSPAKGERA
jgi:1-acyl-sn-glycerol-3-phosphate acyltransferase